MRTKKILLGLFLLLILWVAADLLLPRKTSLRKFDPAVVGQLDADMWRSYYERQRGRLFLQLTRLMRQQFHAPFWRSHLMAFQAAKAAVVFQDGRNRDEYARALPYLEKYFRQINRLSKEPFDVQAVAKNELEWWIIRRDPQYTHADWERVLAQVSATMYHQPESQFSDYARLRVEAMALRDSLGKNITDADWVNISHLCTQSWQALYDVVKE